MDATRTSPAAAAVGRVSVTVDVAVVEELVEVPTAVTAPELPPAVTVIVALADVDPVLLAAVNFAVKVPAAEYWCDGDWDVDVPPSPNVQDHDVGEPVDVSVKLTGRGAGPDVGEAVKAATGAVGPGAVPSGRSEYQ